MNAIRLSLFLGLAVALSGIASTVQAGCSTAARNVLNQEAQNEQKNDQTQSIYTYVAQSNAPGSIGKEGVAQCATATFPIQLPGVLSILSGMADDAIQSTCNQLRSQVSQQMPSYLKGLYNVVSTNGANTTSQQAVQSVVTPSNVGNLFGGGQ